MNIESLEFPFLSPSDFEYACCCFVENVKQRVSKVWESIGLVEVDQERVCVKITRILEKAEENSWISQSNNELADVYHEEDPEALVPNRGAETSVVVESEILLSPTYQVPILYFVVFNSRAPTLYSLDQVYELLVSREWKSKIGDVGIQGAISHGDHPSTGKPALFVHPCNTAEAMRELSSTLDIQLEDYIQVWLGLVGGCVGLSIPLAT